MTDPTCPSPGPSCAAASRPAGRGRYAILTLLALLGAGTLAGAVAPVPPEQLVWRNWGVEEGLPQITVHDLTQDRDGFLWVATQEGVVRFDGVEFDSFAPTEGSVLRRSMPNALAMDEGNRLWVGAVDGLAVLEDGEYVARALTDGSPVRTVIRLVPGRSGGMWVATVAGLLRAGGGALEPLDFPGLGSPAVVSVIDDGLGEIVVAGHLDLVFDPLGEPRVVPLAGRMPGVLDIARDGEGGFWLGTRNGLVRIDGEGEILKHSLHNHEVERLRHGPDGRLWLATDRGLVTWSAEHGLHQHAVPGINDTAWVRSVFFDHEDTLWVGTQLTGLHRAWADRFRRIDAAQGLTDEAVWSVVEDHAGVLWAGTPDGLYRGSLAGFNKVYGAGDLPHPMVRSILHDSTGRLWIGTRYGLAVRERDGRLHTVEEAGNDGIDALLEVPGEGVWIAAMPGLFLADGERVVPIGLDTGEGPPGFKALAVDAHGALWAGGFQGAFIRTAAGWQRVPTADGSHPVVMSMTPLPGGGMLASTHEGLVAFGADGSAGRRVDRDQGLHDGLSSYTAIVDDTLWYLTVLGIGAVPLEQALGRHGETGVKPARVLGGIGDGHLAQCNGGHQAAGAVAAGRWLLCPSLRGLLALDLQAPTSAPAPPAPRIRRLSTSGRSVAGGGEVRLPAAERDLRIDFSIASLRAPEQLRFESRLVGYESEWQPQEQRRSVFYTNLPASAYRFEIRAVDRDGQAGPAAVQTFLILPRWYETWYARTAAVVFALIAVWLLLRWRLARIRAQRQKLRRAVAERTRELDEANARLERASTTDPLTGLRNRRFLGQVLPMDVARADRLADSESAQNPDIVFLHVDLDHFKQINDRHGHQVGDAVLVELARILRESARASDVVARWGGEEFILVGRESCRGDAANWGRRVLEAVRAHHFAAGSLDLRLTCSIGYAAYPARSACGQRLDWEAVLDLADAATYLAKRAGRDRCCGIELTGRALPPDFTHRLHRDPEALRAAGVIDILWVESADHGVSA